MLQGKIWQKIFYAFVLFGTLWRGTSFFIMPAIQQDKISLSNLFNVFFNTYPSVIFFTAYFVILFLWVEIFHFTTAESSGSTLRQFRTLFFFTNVFIHILVLVLFTLDAFTHDPDDDAEIPTYNTIYQKFIVSFCALMYFVFSFAFGFYGFKLYQYFQNMKQLTRHGVVSKLLSITIIFTIFFSIRGVLVILGIVYDLGSDYWWYDPIYYFFFELVPISLMFLVFRSQTTKPPEQSANRLSYRSEPSEEKTPINQQNGWYSN